MFICPADSMRYRLAQFVGVAGGGGCREPRPMQEQRSRHISLIEAASI